MNHKRVHRVYRKAGLMIRGKKRKHCVRQGRRRWWLIVAVISLIMHFVRGRTTSA